MGLAGQQDTFNQNMQVPFPPALVHRLDLFVLDAIRNSISDVAADVKRRDPRKR